jgi:hypothetical protein
MIQSISNKYKKHIAYPMLVLFYLQTIILPLHAAAAAYVPVWNNYSSGSVKNHTNDKTPIPTKVNNIKTAANKKQVVKNNNKPVVVLNNKKESKKQSPLKLNIGGPSAPEASSFKAVGSNNLVNLFTGDFSYSIPLLDVGGYPVNLFYTGGIGMEQEASWVGLGWNINPGTVSRSMRGVPDDFNGDDKLIQTQKVKPNRTWGGEVGIDGELIGRKKPNVNFSLGVSYNNYLGAAFEIGAGVSVSIPIVESIKSEKGVPTTDTTTLSANLGIGVKLSSRSGLTFSPSLGASLATNFKKDDIGVGLSTSYNSRTGISGLNLNLTASKSYSFEYGKKDAEGKRKTANSSISGTLGETSINFARPSYIPSLRMPMQYGNYSGQLELGLGMFGIRGSAHGQGYYSESKVPAELETMYKPLVGYMYSEKANGNPNAVMDLQRMNDAEVTPNTPILSAPQYNYDVFSIQGEGTGSSIRAYRGDLGFMRDNETNSKNENISIGLDIAPPGHYGINWNVINTPTRVGGWQDGNNKLIGPMSFVGKASNAKFENVYFRSPGEATVTNPELLERIGGDNLVRFELKGSNVAPTLEPRLEMFDKKMPVNSKGYKSVTSPHLQERDKRTQVTTMLTAAEASEIGLEKEIRNYTGGFTTANNIDFTTINRIDQPGPNYNRKPHHISEINVLEQTGMRYVYGVPVYNTKQKDYTFSIENDGDPNTGISTFIDAETGFNSPHMNNKSRLDGYLMAQETPAYAASFLLTGLISPDFVDVTGNGITEDDLGNAVKFDYTKSADKHKWRTPRGNGNGKTAHFNDGLKSIRKDNKATISYGEREVWYLNAVESKAMVAIFKTGSRLDAKGVKGELDGSIDINEQANKRLDRIDLYTKAEIKAKGYANAIPIKTVNFVYDYSLCQGTPDKKDSAGTLLGKLTLKSVFFTYYGRTRANKDKYIFDYNYSAATAAVDNPNYAYQASDKWGTYKPPTTNPAGLTNADFPYTSTNKAANDAYAGAWSLKRILLPSGGQMEVQYEADDYGYVQNRKASDMFNIYGIGKNTDAVVDNGLYEKSFFATALLSTDNDYVYVQIPQPLQGTTEAAQKQEILERYLQGLGEDEQLAFKLFLDVPKGNEPLNVYAKFDEYGLCTNRTTEKDIIYFKLRKVDKKSPLARAAIGFLVESLPGQAFPNSEMEVNSIKDFLGVIVNLLNDIRNAFKGVDDQMRSQGKARTIGLAKSFIRLADPDRIKYGGGVRVKKVLVKDNWNKMTNQYTSTYGQEYDYTTTDKIQGKDVTISSGVASYETGIGSEENPFREIVAFSNKMPLATAQYGAIEMPLLDALYPSPGVGYSKVTVRSIHRNATLADTTKRIRSAIGKQVTEYYTAKEYPAYSSFTAMNSKEHHFNSFGNIFYKEITDRKTTSQGFLVETNDMHGKMKSQIAYSESDEKTPLSYSYHTYKNTGRNGLNDKVDFVNNATGGTVTQGNMGIDMELMTDVREFKVETNGKNGQLQTDFFTFVPFPFFAIPKLFLKTVTENRYRSVTCTKLINYHAIEDSVIVMDKGSIVSTKTIAYDAETGTPLVTKTANEFNDPIYNVSYPAHWAYSGVGLAYKNIDRQIKANFIDGKITLLPPTTSEAISDIFESGDELYITGMGTTADACAPMSSSTIKKIWAYDSSKNSTALTVPVTYLLFMDATGKLYNRNGVTCRIVRSGKRNNLGLTVSGATCMAYPIQNGKLVINNADKIVSASAVEYKEKWQVDNDLFPKFSSVYDNANCTYNTVVDCVNGKYEQNINPYIKGLIGNFKPYRSYTYYGDRTEITTNNTTAIRKNGYLNNFTNYWNFIGTNNNLLPDVTNTKWVWNSELTKLNSKGQELETKNALEIYTAAQYGFAKNQATAVANNSRVNEMFAESFEDSNYGEYINTGNYINNCAKKQIDFGSFVNTNSLGINAHSGKSCLKVDNILTKRINLNQSIVDEYSLSNEKDTAKTNVDIGANGAFTFKFPYNSYFVEGNNYFTQSNDGMRLYVNPFSDTLTFYNGGYWRREHSFSYLTYQYYNISSDGIYEITTKAYSDGLAPNTYGHPYVTSANMSFQIFNANGIYVPATYINQSNGIYTFSSCLKKGVYKVLCFANGLGYSECTYTGSENGNQCSIPFLTVDVPEYNFILNINSQPGYKNLTAENGCITTLPIPATDSMLNPIFSPTPNKKMHFSAWVREGCTTTPCTKLNYNDSKVKIMFNDGSNTTATINPTGGIIEGWQKVEGDFFIPLTATTMDMKFENTGTTPNYWDDIRVHPFNANMKSYAYDPTTLRLSAELDENNYATFYEYDEEGQLIRVKKETAQGIKTIKETRSAKQQGVIGVVE